jgi:hypothetical protein
MNRFTLLYKVGIQLFYKVVHIIQEQVLVYYYYNHSSTMPNHHNNVRCFKDTPKQILLTNHAFRCGDAVLVRAKEKRMVEQRGEFHGAVHAGEDGRTPVSNFSGVRAYHDVPKRATGARW